MGKALILLDDDDLNDRDCINCDHYKDYKCGDNNTVKCCECWKCQFAPIKKGNEVK